MTQKGSPVKLKCPQSCLRFGGIYDYCWVFVCEVPGLNRYFFPLMICPTVT